MRVARTRGELAGLPRGRRRAMVMTMGALHDGHRALLRAAAAAADDVLVSVFVNPLQFGPGEDFDRYPRELAADLEVCRAEGVAAVFAPPASEVFPGGAPQVRVDPGPLGGQLEGASRPGHFAGVLTVVAVLLGLGHPDLAVFGEKDFQQLVLVRRMVADLAMSAEVVAVPTVREGDGLARSSRNRLLDPASRDAAAALSRGLRTGVAAAATGAPPADVLAAARAVLSGAPPLAVDYLVLTDPELGDPRPGPGRLLVAARVGGVRLIDNAPLVLTAAAGGRPAENGSPCC